MQDTQHGNLTHRWARAIMRFFPDREIMLRTDGKVRFLKVSKALQVSSFGVIVVAAGWAIFTSFSFFIHDKVVASKNREILDARMVYRSLLSEVSDYQNKFSNLTTALGKNHGLMLDLVEKNATLQQNLRSAENQLESSNTRHQRIVTARAELKSKLSGIENEMKALNGHNFSLKGNLNSITTNLENALSERNFALSQSKKLSNTVSKLENELATLHKTEKDILVNLTARTKDNIDDIQYVLKRTGINVVKLLKDNKDNDDNSENESGQGGPFIALKPDSEPGQRLKTTLSNLNSHLKEFSELQLLMKRLPISAPLDYFTISSHYGKRRDPINKRWAMHYGLDFGGIKNTAVFVTAPGTVTYAGRKGRYGKLIEIDHGLGFKTRYGHLNKILVKRGQKVDYRTKIGLMGSTGRSTGPHLHYEVFVMGKHQNPWRFIKAGRYVYKRQ